MVYSTIPIPSIFNPSEIPFSFLGFLFIFRPTESLLQEVQALVYPVSNMEPPRPDSPKRLRLVTSLTKLNFNFLPGRTLGQEIYLPPEYHFLLTHHHFYMGLQVKAQTHCLKITLNPIFTLLAEISGKFQVMSLR